MTIYSYKWHEIDKYMTIPIYKELSKHQKKFPPLYQLVCSYFGVGTFKEGSENNKNNTLSTGSLAMMRGGGYGEVPEPREI